MKLGILGGTFNPVHIGHLILAEEVREKAALDKIIFVPTYLAPHKDNSEIAAASDRFQMLKNAIKGNRYFAVSDVEIKRQGQSYTENIQDTSVYPDFARSLGLRQALFMIMTPYPGTDKAVGICAQVSLFEA